MTNRKLLAWLASTLIAAVGAVVQVPASRAFADEPGDFPNYALVEKGLYIGGFVNKPPPGTQAVLNLCGAEDPYAKEVQVHRWEPIADISKAPSVDWLRKQVEFVDQQRRAGRTTYVHCFAGISRAGMVVTAYLMDKNGWSRAEALAYVRKSRPIRPNPAFMKCLGEWEKHVKEKGR
jgi:protein-tyrosine phosphatase